MAPYGAGLDPGKPRPEVRGGRWTADLRNILRNHNGILIVVNQHQQKSAPVFMFSGKGILVDTLAGTTMGLRPQIGRAL